VNTTQFDELKKKSGCIFAIIDHPRLLATQELHNASRTLEIKVKRGARFIAIDKKESPTVSKKALGGQDYGAFVYNKGNWVPYKGEADPAKVQQFLNDQKCGVVLLTPTPTPEPLPELPDIPVESFEENENDDDPTPAERAEAFRKRNQEKNEEKDKDDDDDDSEEEVKVKQKGKKEKPVEDEGDDNVSEWSNDDEI
jgi:hypothetical protein